MVSLERCEGGTKYEGWMSELLLVGGCHSRTRCHHQDHEDGEGNQSRCGSLTSWRGYLATYLATRVRYGNTTLHYLHYMDKRYTIELLGI